MKIMTLLGMVGACWTVGASAAEITFYTGDGATAGGAPVNAEAVFNIDPLRPGELTITLRNLQPDPGSVIQCISGLSFTLQSGLTGGILTSSEGQERVINADGTYIVGSVVDAGWSFSGSSLYLDDLTGKYAAGPTHTLIGSPGPGGIYTGNSSITGNGAHNPFLYGDATFVLNIPGLLETDTVTRTQFQFGTSGEMATINGTVPDGGATLAMFGMGLCGLYTVGKRKLMK